jgi:NhaP-type Na+/H+ or K+/H+ antiporter
MGLNLDLLEVSAPGLAYICLGGFVVAFSTVSLLVKERLYINEVVLGTAFGVIMGPHVANVFDPRSWGSHSNAITLEVMRIVLATGLFAIGVELPQAYMAEHAKGLLVMVVPTMAFGWIVVAAIIRGLFPSLNFVSALAIAACLTPTDPIICAAIVGGKYAIKHVPVNLRRILSAESAANDGLAYPFLSISIYLTVESSLGTAFGKWFLVGWLYQVILGVVLGALLGMAFSYLMQISHRKGFVDRESYVAQYLALAFFTIGIASTIGSDDLLAAFAAGTAVSWDGHFNTQTENEVFSSVIDLVLNCGCFVYIGAWLPFQSFNAPGLGITVPRLLILFFAILFLRRIPSLLLLFKWIPEITTWREALFSGHFGPMGVGAVFISSLALTRLPVPHDPPQNQQELLAATLQPIVSFIVLCSIIIHGLSIPFFSFGRRVHSRTVSLSATFTSRSRGDAPDWLLWVQRSAGAPQPGISTIVSDVDVDVERAVESTVTDADTVAGVNTIAPVSDDERKTPVLEPTSMTHSNPSKTLISFEINKSQVEVESQNITALTTDHDDGRHSGIRDVQGTESSGPNRVSGMQSKTVHFPASQ